MYPNRCIHVLLLQALFSIVVSISNTPNSQGYIFQYTLTADFNYHTIDLVDVLHEQRCITNCTLNLKATF